MFSFTETRTDLEASVRVVDEDVESRVLLRADPIEDTSHVRVVRVVALHGDAAPASRLHLNTLALHGSGHEQISLE